MTSSKKPILVRLKPEILEAVQVFQIEYQRRTGIERIGQSDAISYLIERGLELAQFESRINKAPTRPQSGKYLRQNQLEFGSTLTKPIAAKDNARPVREGPGRIPSEDEYKKYPPGELALAARKQKTEESI